MAAPFGRSRYAKRFAANKHNSTVPDVTAVTVMLNRLRTAVEKIDFVRSTPSSDVGCKCPFSRFAFWLPSVGSLKGSGPRNRLTLTLPRRVDPDRVAQHRRSSGSKP
jgi:hypothetical protein